MDMTTEIEMEIIAPNTETDANFDFKTISLADPQPLAGQVGYYFTQLTVGDEPKKHLCLQLPSCFSKQAVVSTKTTKYMDLMFERHQHDALMKWLEHLEYACQDIIDAKKELWFQTELTRDDIETMMTQITRLYQSGKYVLMRAYMDPKPHKCIAYDENEMGVDLELLTPTQAFIPLVMIEGVKFSAKSFEISLKLIQLMVIGKTEKAKSNCLIKRSSSTISTKPDPLVKTLPPANLVKKTVSIQAPPLLAPAAVKPAAVKPAVSIQQPLVSQQQPLVSQQQPLVSQQQPLVSQQQPLVSMSSIKRPNTMLGPGRNVPAAPVPAVPVPVSAAPVPAVPVPQTPAPIRKNIPAPSISTKNPPQIPINLEKSINTNDTNMIDDIDETNATDELNEIDIDYNDVSDTINLKNPNEVYYEIYKKAREKAKEYRLLTLEAYLKAKQIKTKYMLANIDDSDEEDENYDMSY
jgi:hypothetical protein